MRFFFIKSKKFAHPQHPSQIHANSHIESAAILRRLSKHFRQFGSFPLRRDPKEHTIPSHVQPNRDSPESRPTDTWQCPKIHQYTRCCSSSWAKRPLHRILAPSRQRVPYCLPADKQRASSCCSISWSRRPPLWFWAEERHSTVREHFAASRCCSWTYRLRWARDFCRESTRTATHRRWWARRSCRVWRDSDPVLESLWSWLSFENYRLW